MTDRERAIVNLENRGEVIEPNQVCEDLIQREIVLIRARRKGGVRRFRKHTLSSRHFHRR